MEITKFSERDSGIIDIDATIYCEKGQPQGHHHRQKRCHAEKDILHGAGGLRKFMGTKVFLTTWVKVKENWRDSDFLVRNFGYSE